MRHHILQSPIATPECPSALLIRFTLRRFHPAPSAHLSSPHRIPRIAPPARGISRASHGGTKASRGGARAAQGRVLRP
jgi:hypothetical protein